MVAVIGFSRVMTQPAHRVGRDNHVFAPQLGLIFGIHVVSPLLCPTARHVAESRSQFTDVRNTFSVSASM